jgi:hypothetical protein
MASELCTLLLNGLLKGEIVPLLGAGVNRCAMPESSADQTLPDGYTLGQWMRDEFTDTTKLYGGNHAEWCNKLRTSKKERDKFLKEIPKPENLPALSQFVEQDQDRGGLNKWLNEIFKAPPIPTPVHIFFANLVHHLKEHNDLSGENKIPYPIVVTTNYDLALETAYQNKGLEFDVLFLQKGISNLPSGLYRRRYSKVEKVYQNTTSPHPITDEEMAELMPLSGVTYSSTSPIIVKIHGTYSAEVNMPSYYIITEDDFIEFTADHPIPPTLMQAIKQRELCFLGYQVKDWNMRVILREIEAERLKKAEAPKHYMVVRDIGYIERVRLKNMYIKVFDNHDFNTFFPEMIKELEARGGRGEKHATP